VRARYLEDFAAGDEIVSLGRTITEEAIINFAAQYDPQSFHIDVEAAKATSYGGLIASGFQTLAIGFRLFIDTGTIAGTSIGSPGMDDVRWVKPVRPGDTLHTIVRVLEARPSATKLDRGIVRLLVRVLNGHDEEVLTLATSVFVLRRPTSPAKT
jgi:acyl dehydratase